MGQITDFLFFSASFIFMRLSVRIMPSVKDHFGFIRGEQKWLKHICAACWTHLGKQELHQENSSHCPSKALAAKESVVASNRTPNPNTQFIDSTGNGRTICRNFNCSRGCSFQNCKFVHICNRHVAGGKACVLNQVGFNHVAQSTQQQQSKPATPN